MIGSKWGYTYVGGWDLTAPVQEVKDLSLATFERQYAETRALLGDHLRLYQVHSLTIESGALEDGPLLAALARCRRDGLLLGITTTGPKQADDHPPGTRGPRRRRAAVLVGAGDLEPARAVGRAGAGRGVDSWMGGDREGGGGQRQAHSRRRRGRRREPARQRCGRIRTGAGRARDRGGARAAVGLGRAQRRRQRRTADRATCALWTSVPPRFRTSPSRRTPTGPPRSARPWT